MGSIGARPESLADSLPARAESRCELFPERAESGVAGTVGTPPGVKEALPLSIL